MKHTLTRKITIMTAVSFLVIAVVIGLVLSKKISSIIEQNYNSSQKAASGMISQIYEGLDLEKIDSETSDMLTDLFAVLQDELGLNNVYVIIPDYENDTIEYVSIRTTDGTKAFVSIHGEEDGVIQEGDVVEHHFSDEETYRFKNGDWFEFDNKYGHSYASFSPIYSDSSHTKVSGLVGIEVSYADVNREKKNLFLAIYSVFILLAAGACVAINLFLRNKFLKRTESMSREMQKFTESGIYGIQDMHIDDDGRDEIGRIAESFNAMSDRLRVSLEEAKKLRLEKAKIEAELELAGKIQMNMLPDLFFETDAAVVNASIKPAAYIGGDFFYYDMAPNGNIVIAIGDVCGKGIMAAMVMSEIITVMGALVHANRNPAWIAKIVNDVLTVKNSEEMFVSLFVASYDPQTGILTYTDAGHNPPYVVRKNGIPEKLDARIDMMTGLFPEEEYHETEIALGSGDRVFLYTDGVNEAENENREQFDYERMERVLKEDSDDIIGSMTRSIDSFAGKTDQSDDITMLVLTVK